MSRAVRMLSALLIVLAMSVGLEPLARAEGSAETAPAPTGKRIVQVTTRMEVANQSDAAVRNFTVVVPPVVMDLGGTQRVLAVKFATEPVSTRETAAGVEATYKVPLIQPGEALTIEQTYTVELDAGAQAAVAVEEAIDPRYLQPETWVESDNPAIMAKAAEVTRGLTTNTAKAKAITQFVSRHITYSLSSPSRNKGGLAGFTTSTGVCSEYAGLFVAMARASGVPARLIYGWAGSSALIGKLDSANRHVWAEFYEAGRGWVPVDPTFAKVQSLENVLDFSGTTHVAQDWSQTGTAISYNGRGFLTIITSQTLADTGAPATEVAMNAGAGVTER